MTLPVIGVDTFSLSRSSAYKELYFPRKILKPEVEHLLVLLSLLLLSMMTLITGFTCPPTIYFKFITKCDKCYYKVRQLFLLQSAMVCYYKVRQLFYYKVRQVLLQSATGITKCDNFITKCDRYYKVRRLLQSATVQRYQICIARFLHSYRNNLLKSLGKTTVKEC